MKRLLDTSAYSALLRGHERVARLVSRSERILLSPVVAGELFHGFRQGSRLRENLEELEVFLASPRVQVLSVTLLTADRFARIMSALRARGTPLPTNDVWIAAQTFETGAELVSFDRHFARVDGLVWVHPDE